MGYMDEELWTLLVKKVEEEDVGVRPELHVANEYITAVKKICQYGVQLAITIRDRFPMYTLHDETHICNVMRIMMELIGNNVERLTRDEVAMLIMTACCHDIGMSFNENDIKDLLDDTDRLNQYLDNNHSEYVKAYLSGEDKPTMTDAMMQRYLRSIHHERVLELICKLEWPNVLKGRVERESLIRVCQSHGKDICALDNMESTSTIDLRFCAILLRLSDILDFDTSRAPQAVYEYSGFDNLEDENVIKSKEEWDKHLASQGFDFTHVVDRTYPYVLEYNANCKSMQVEQTVNSFLDWVEYEFNECGRQLQRYNGKWKDFILPRKIKRNIRAEGYMSGQYRLTLDQEQVMDLLVGRDLYSDPSVFVRELIQNAIDAVRTREKLDRDLPTNWKGQINIRTWMDNEGYHWFRIEDNGIGMTEEIIKNYFLKIGRSYYTSDNFLQSKIRCKADKDYTPISRFGIGILSCFMGDEKSNRVEVSTKHFSEGGKYYPALRMSMHGMNGYYYMASRSENHLPGPMKGVTAKEQEQYLKQAGTVIAVRNNLYQTGKYKSFKEIVDRYVTYPPVAIHYDGVEGSFDYPTEGEFISCIHNLNGSGKKGVAEWSLSEEQVNELKKERPEINFAKRPSMLLHCVPLDYYSESPFLSGAVLTVTTESDTQNIEIKIGKQHVLVDVKVEPKVDEARKKIGIRVYLDFPYEFEKKIGLLRENRDDVRESYGHTYKKIMKLFEGNIYLREIAEAICRGYAGNMDWCKYVTETYNVSVDDLKKTIRENEKKIYEATGVSVLTQDEREVLDYYEKMKKEWIYDCCNLEQYDWYKAYFDGINKKGSNSIVAHNGILCGKGDFFYKDRYKDENLGTILLLKDKYRPKVDVARDGIRMLTLETASDIEIIRREVGEKGIDLEGDREILLSEHWRYLTINNYMDILGTRKDFVEKLKFKTDKGVLRYDELEIQLEKYGKIRIFETPYLSDERSWSRDNRLYNYLCMAFLRKHYSIRNLFSNYDNEIYILKKQDVENKKYDELFPVCLFMKPMGESTCLTNGRIYYRQACNEDHKLSQFVLYNGEKMVKHVPGIFNEILRSLMEDKEEDLINNINNLLSLLRTLPGGLFEVPDDIFLSKKDFV